MSTPRQQHGASPVGENKKGGAWWKWLLALLLLLLVILAIVLIAGGGDDEDTDTASTGTATVPAATTPAQAATPATTAPATAPDAGTLTAEGQSLLGTGDKTATIDKDATGDAVKVLSVTDGGFFVGTSAEDRMFVEYAGDVGVDEPTAGAYRPAVGDLVDLEGPVAEAPKDPADTLKLDPADARVVTEQGAYVNADEVEQAD